MDNLRLVRDLFAIGHDPREILKTIHAAFEGYSGKLQPGSGALAETVTSLSAKAKVGVIFGILDDQRVAACVRAVPKEKSLYLDRLAVHPDYQRRDLAAALVNAVEAEAARRELPSVTLSVRLALQSNIALSSSLGFVETGRAIHDGFDAPTSINMAKQI